MNIFSGLKESAIRSAVKNSLNKLDESSFDEIMDSYYDLQKKVAKTALKMLSEFSKENEELAADVAVEVYYLGEYIKSRDIPALGKRVKEAVDYAVKKESIENNMEKEIEESSENLESSGKKIIEKLSDIFEPLVNIFKKRESD